MRRPVFMFLLVCATIALCTLVFVQTMFDYLDSPMVYKSYHTKRCVKVETAPTQKSLTCEDINTKSFQYETIWIK